MEPIELCASMTNAAEEVLNSMFFIGVESSLETCGEAAGTDESWIAAKVEFQGPRPGSFGISAPLPTARLLASNFLGQDEAELENAQAMEVLCELSNMVCGAFLSTLGGEGVYDLSHPTGDSLSATARPGAISRFLQLDEGQMQVWLQMEPVS